MQREEGGKGQEGHRKTPGQTEERVLCIHEHMEQGRRTSPSQHEKDGEGVFPEAGGIMPEGKTLQVADDTWTPRVLAKSRQSSKGAHIMRAVLTEDAGVNPFLGRTEESPAPVLTAIFFYVHT